jgi:hypothetical protein
MGAPATPDNVTAALDELANVFSYKVNRRDKSVRFLSDHGVVRPAFELLGGDEIFLYFGIRTTSWDFEGERTDLHDALSLFPAVTLRGLDVSCALWDIPNMFTGISTELYGRYITVDQPTNSVYRMNEEGIRQLKVLLAAVRLFEVRASCFFEWDRNVNQHSGASYTFEDRYTKRWANKVARAVGEKTSSRHIQYNRRRNPSWFYYRSVAKHLSVFRSGVLALRLRQFLLALGEEVRCLPTVTGQAYVSTLSRNFVADAEIVRAERLLTALEPRRRATVLVLPIESHLVAVGAEHVVAIRQECGKRAFDEERERLRSRRSVEDALFFPGATLMWADRIDDARFELLVHDLLAVEPGVRWIRRVGQSREPDEGRDLMCEWATPPAAGESIHDQIPPLAIRKVVVQCKASRVSVGKAIVQDVYDTVKRHASNGYFLAVSSQLTVSMIRFMENLRNGGEMWADWWTRSEIEDRLRRHPEILLRYSDVVKSAMTSSV